MLRLIFLNTFTEEPYMLKDFFKISHFIYFISALVNCSYADTSNSCYTCLSGPLDQQSLIAATKQKSNNKTYMLPAVPATTQWGIFDSNQKPVLTVKPGDTIAIETLAASDNQVVPGATIDQILKIQHADPKRGPHTITGPIYVEGAEPGDVLKIKINKIIPRSYASNNTNTNKGLFPKEFPDLFVKYYYLDLKNNRMVFSPNISIPLAPFPGIVAVARKEPGRYNTSPPGPFGGNMDLRELTEGSTLYLPVFMKGALLWTGDSHAGQGNGEIDLTAMETAFQEFNITVDVIKNKNLSWPRVETPTAWISVGYDENLNKALTILQDETIKLIAETRHVSPTDAKKIMFETWNCPIAEVVNGVKGVYCIIAKDQNVKNMGMLTTDDKKHFVTHAKDPDVEKAMKRASMDMLNQLVTIKKMSKNDAYVLASFTMDCRIAPLKTNDKEVFCSIDKNLWHD